MADRARGEGLHQSGMYGSKGTRESTKQWCWHQTEAETEYCIHASTPVLKVQARATRLVTSEDSNTHHLHCRYREAIHQALLLRNPHLKPCFRCWARLSGRPAVPQHVFEVFSNSAELHVRRCCSQAARPSCCTTTRLGPLATLNLWRVAHQP